MPSVCRSSALALSPVAVAAVMSLVQPATALAQQATPAASGIQQVEVTARRRVETQFDVPASVTAIGGNELKAAGITAIEDIVALMPNANMTENPQGTDTYISIRGMRQGDTRAEPNFGMYRNGIFAGGHRVNLGAQVDIARLELVRGPQGGLYGRNAVGGALNVVYNMPKPGDSANGYATIGLEDVGARLEGAATIPLDARVAVRGTAWLMEQRKGDYYDTVLQREVDRARDSGLRLSAAATFGGGLSALVTVEASRGEGPSQRTYAPNGVPNGPAVISPAETRRTIQRDTDSRNEIDQNYVAGRLTWNLDAGSLSLMGSVRDYGLSAVLDQDQSALKPSAGPLVLQQVLTRREDITQKYLEALWESDPGRPLTWRAGLSYFTEQFDLDQRFASQLDTAYLGSFGIPKLGVVGGSAGIPGAGSGMHVSSWSAFADLRYEFSKQLAATATLRRTVDRQSLHWAQGIDPTSHPVATALFANVVPTFTLDARDTYSFTSPSVGLEFRVSKDVNAYALYSTGYRPGGYNTSVTNPAYIPYGKETARNIEAGIKVQMMGGRAGLNLSVFQMDQKDLTIQQDDPVDTRFGFGYLANVGKARTTGFEAEFMVQPSRDWTLRASVGHLNAEYTQGLLNAGTANQVDVTGRSLQGVRPWTLNARVDYRQPVAGMELTAGVALRREIGGALGDLSDRPMQALTKIDLNAGLRINSRTQVGAYVRNATDEQIVLFRFENGAVGTNAGRRIGLQLTHQFF